MHCMDWAAAVQATGWGAATPTRGMLRVGVPSVVGMDGVTGRGTLSRRNRHCCKGEGDHRPHEHQVSVVRSNPLQAAWVTWVLLGVDKDGFQN